MVKLYVNKETGRFTTLIVDETDNVRVPEGWERYEGSMPDAHSEGLSFLSYFFAGFNITPKNARGETSH